MIAKRPRKTQGKRQEYSYSPMIWVKNEDGTRRQLWGGTFKTKAEAKVAERKLLEQRDSGADFSRSRITVAEVCQQYMQEKRNKVKASTLQRSEELLDHFLPIFGSTPAAKLRPSDISKAYVDLLYTLSKRTVRHCHWQLHGALELAVRWGQIPVNVASRVDPPVPDAFEGRALTPDEVEHLLEAVRGEALAPLVMLALDTGAREGELLALRWSNVDFDTSLVHIGRSVRRLKEGFVFSEPKTKRSKRTVEVSVATMAVMRAHRQRQLEQRLRAGELWDDHDLVFSTETGRPYDSSFVSRWFRRLAADAGLEGFRFHDLRHSSLSLLLKSGVQMVDVSRRAGHSNIGTTVDTYGHQLGAGGGMAAMMEGILRKAISDPDGWLANGEQIRR